MLKALREVKPVINRRKEWELHMKKADKLKQNLSHWRKVGKSQPRARNLMQASEDEELKCESNMNNSFLPSVNGSTGNNSRMNTSYSHIRSRIRGAVPTSQ